MSAASPRFPDAKLPDAKARDGAGEKAHEPSMEEILASIRRIIADDQATKPAEPAVEPDDVLDLAEVAEPVARAPAPNPAPAPPPAARKPEPEPEPLDFDAIDFGPAEVDLAARWYCA